MFLFLRERLKHLSTVSIVCFMMSTLCATLLAIVMCLGGVAVNAAPKRVLNPIKGEVKQIYIPVNVSNNDGWIPIRVIEEMNMTKVKEELVLLYIYGHDGNDSVYRGEGDKPAPPPFPVGLIFFIALLGGVVSVLLAYAIAILVLRQMRKREESMIHHGQTTSLP